MGRHDDMQNQLSKIGTGGNSRAAWGKFANRLSMNWNFVYRSLIVPGKWNNQGPANSLTEVHHDPPEPDRASGECPDRRLMPAAAAGCVLRV